VPIVRLFFRVPGSRSHHFKEAGAFWLHQGAEFEPFSLCFSIGGDIRALQSRDAYAVLG